MHDLPRRASCGTGRQSRGATSGTTTASLRNQYLPMLDGRAYTWAKAALKLMESNLQILSVTDLTGGQDQSWTFVWRQTVLWLLTHRPEDAANFLVVTHAKPYMPASYIREAYQYLAKHWLRSDHPEKSRMIQKLISAMCLLVDREGKTSLSLHNSLLRFLMPHCSDIQIQDLYRALKANNVWLGSNGDTFLHFCQYFARNDHFGLAHEALMSAANVGADLNGFPFLSVCSTLLRACARQPEGLRVSLRLVQDLVDMGVILDRMIYDIIMLNAVYSGDTKTAFDIYYSLAERGLKPAEGTFVALLKGCKTDIRNGEMLNGVINDAIANVNVRKSEALATEILHCLAMHHAQLNPKTALHSLTVAYAQLFDTRPLIALGLTIPELTQAKLPDDAEPMMPTNRALTFVVRASIEHHLAQSSSSINEILSLYERWRTQVEAGDPSLAKLATTSHFSDLFLNAFIRRPRGLIHAARLVKYRQRPLPESAGVVQCLPTVYTWNIFLMGFRLNGKHELAEQVVTYMRSKGIEPDNVTWNSLTGGWAGEQDLGRTIDAIRRAEESGFVWDYRTHRGLRRFRDQQRLHDALKKMRLERNLDFAAELKQGLSDRLSAEPQPVEVSGKQGDCADVIEEEGLGTRPIEHQRPHEENVAVNALAPTTSGVEGQASTEPSLSAYTEI